MNKNLLQNTINELYNNTPDYVHSVSYGYKRVNYIFTNDKAIIFKVLHKKPINEIPENEILPTSIVIDGETIPTDIIEMAPIRALASYRSDCFKKSNASSATNRTKHRPAVAGCSVARTGLTAGTLGLIVKDKEDGSIVGLTNNHVIVNNAFLTSSQSDTGVKSNIQAQAVVQPGPADGGTNPADRLGYTKRYWPLGPGFVEIDAALMSINDLDLDSYKILGLDNAQPLPFASTTEIDNLLESQTPLFKSGRTTGAIGFPNCPIQVLEENITVAVSGYNNQGSAQTVTFSNCMSIVYNATVNRTDPYDGQTFTFNRENVCVGGDSGSIVVADISGIEKIVGLVFAGGSLSRSRPDGTFFEPLKDNYGVFCRIDKVALQLNIEPWNGISVTYSNPSDWQYITKSGKSSSPIIFENSKKYWQAGSINSSTSTIDTRYVTFNTSATAAPTTPTPGTTTPGPGTTLPPGTTIPPFTTVPPTTPPPDPGTCDIYIDCAFVFNKDSSSISLYLVYEADYSYTDTYLELEFYDILGNTIQPYTAFKKVNTLYDVIKINSTDPLLNINLSDICSVGARLYQPHPCLPASFDGSGSDEIDDCNKTTLGDMTGYLVEAIYVEVTNNAPCIPPQSSASSLNTLTYINNNSQSQIIKTISEDYAALQNLGITDAGSVSGCGIVVESPCGGGHACNRALFDIFLATSGNPDVKVLEANLNNLGSPDNGPSTVFGGTWPPLPDGIGLAFYDRYSSSVITKAQNDAIFSGLPPATDYGDPNYAVTVKIVANPLNTNPHLDITWVRIKDTCGRIVYSCCIGEGVLDPDPCCERGGGPTFPCCPNYSGPPVPECPCTTTTTTTAPPSCGTCCYNVKNAMYYTPSSSPNGYKTLAGISPPGDGWPSTDDGVTITYFATFKERLMDYAFNIGTPIFPHKANEGTDTGIGSPWQLLAIQNVCFSGISEAECTQCDPPLTLEALENLCGVYTPGTDCPSGGSGSAAVLSQTHSKNDIIDILNNNNINYRVDNNIIKYSNKPSLIELLASYEVYTSVPSYSYDSVSKEWIKTMEEITDNFIINCNDGLLTFELMDGE